MNLKCLLGHWWVNDPDDVFIVKGVQRGTLFYFQLILLNNISPIVIAKRSSIYSFIDDWANLITPNAEIVHEWSKYNRSPDSAISWTVKKRHCSACGLEQVKVMDGDPRRMLAARRMAARVG